MVVYRVAIIGTGSFASGHVQSLRAVGKRVEVVAAADSNAPIGEAFCETNHIPAFFESVEEMLRTVKPDIVHICTPPFTHTELATLSLELGAHVLCEKPLCGSLAMFDQLMEAQTRAKRHLSTVFQWRFGSAAQHLKQLITTGKLGEALLATCLTLWYRDMAYYDIRWRAQLAEALGGTTVGHGIHLMDLLLWLLPDWQEVQSVMGTLAQPIEVDNVSMALVRFANGGFANIVNSTISPRQETHLRFDFQRATVEVKGLYSADNSNWTFTPASPEDSMLWNLPKNVPGLLNAQITALLDSLDAGEPPLVTGEEARRIIEFLTCFYKSACTGKPVLRNSITSNDPFYSSFQGKT